VASAVRGSLFGGLTVAAKLHSPSLLNMVRSAFVSGMDASLVVAAGIAGAGMILTLIFLPQRSLAKGATPVDQSGLAAGPLPDRVGAAGTR